MRVCDKCSRDFDDGAPPACDDLDCPYRDGLAALEGEDATLIDPNFDRDEVLAMVARAQREDLEGVPGTEATTRLDERPLDSTKLYDDDEDLPGFVESLLSGDDADEATTLSGDELRTSTATQPAPNDETTVEHDAVDGPATLSEEESSESGGETADPNAQTGRMDVVNLDSLDLAEPSSDDPDSPTMLLSPESSEAEDDATHVFEGGDPADLMLESEDEEVDQHTAATVEISKLALAKSDAIPESLKPTLTLADLRASLKKRETSEDTAESIRTLDEPTEQPDTRVDHTAEDEGYDHDETAQMDAADVDGAMGVADPPTSVDGTLQLDDDDLLDFADDLLQTGARTIEMNKDVARQADALNAGVSTVENTRPVPVHQDTTQQDQPSPKTVESLISGAVAQPPQTYPQPHAQGAYPQGDPYGSQMPQYPQQGPAGSGMFVEPGAQHPGQYPQQQYPPPPYGPPGPAPQDLIPYEQQFITPKRGRRVETMVIVMIIVLALIGIVLAVLNFLR